jgi:hypothetical protein
LTARGAVPVDVGGALSMARSLKGHFEKLAKNYTNSRGVVAAWQVFHGAE